MSGQPAVLQVVILRDGLLVGTEALVPGTYVVGSAPDADLRLDDPSVGGRHAVLYFQNGKVAIQDAGAPGGLYVNGHKISACQIRSVDEVACGPFSLKVRVLAQSPGTKPGPPPEVAALLQPTPALGSPPAGPKPVFVPSSELPASRKPAQRVPEATVPSQKSSRRSPSTTGMKSVAAEPVRPSPPPPSKAKDLASELFDDVGSSGAEEPIEEDEHPTLVGGVFPKELAPQPSPALAQPLLTPTAMDRPLPRAEVIPTPAWGTSPAPEDHPDLEREELAAAAPAPAGLPQTVQPFSGKRKLRIYFEVFWGDTRRDARSFRPDVKHPVRAAADESSELPLYGFDLPKDFVIAERKGDTFRLFVPAGAAVERCKAGEPFSPVRASALEAEDGRRCVVLTRGTAARLLGGDGMSVTAYVAPRPDRVFVNPLRGMPLLATTIFILFGAGFGYFLSLVPQTPENPDFAAKNLSPVAVRLIAPSPKKKEAAQKKLQEIKKLSPKKEEKVEKAAKVVEKAVPKAVAAAPETKALKALAKLSAAGPAMGDILAAVDKLGNGPGSKFAKNTDYKLSGLIGKAPIANAGLGTFGLGGGGKGGIGTLGAEILRGKGGGGIGALGAGGVGKGTVGGVVTRASGRSVGVGGSQGSIDREAVAKVVNSHLQEIRGCYERALLKDPALAGKVVLEWVINTSGRVASVKTKTSTLRNSAVEGCIMNELKGWVFPVPRGGQVIITYPFLFNSVGF